MKTTVTENNTKVKRQKRQAEPKRPVSQKFYDDISNRVGIATSYLCDHRTQYLMIMHIIDGYMAGGPAPVRSDGIDALMTFALLRPEIDKAMARSRRAREAAARRREAKAAARTRQPLDGDDVSQQAEVPVTDGDRSVAGGLHGETGGFLESEEQVHGVDRVAGASLEEVVDHGCDEQLASDLVEVDDALVGVDHVFQVRNLGGDEREVVVGEVFAVDPDDLGELQRAVEIADCHYAARE